MAATKKKPAKSKRSRQHPARQNPARQQTAQQSDGLTIRPRYIIAGFILIFFVLGGVYLSQQTKLTTISEEKDTLQTQLDSVKVEEERLDRMLEYMQTDEYLIQYAREKLGYVFPDDIKFIDDGSGAAATPTPAPFGVTDDPNLQ